MVTATALRARFAAALSRMYGDEVPAYRTLVEVAAAVNRDVLTRDGAGAERWGSIERVTAERHGAIRVGSATELRDVTRLFAAFGMHPVGFYDLREAATPIPVVSTAFRPTDPEELARNPFRVFTSMLVTDDRRFFDRDLHRRLDRALATRTLFSPQLLDLADRVGGEGGAEDDDADTLIRLATAAFELDRNPVDRGWYAELSAVSPVAADIGGVASTHINHLTPRVLDIDELYRRMTARGIEMIDRIQGPPSRPGRDVLLRQTSFRALAEPRLFREADGRVFSDEVRVRFGEVEARGVALTRAGRERYDTAMAAPDPDAVWDNHFPTTETALAASGLGYYTVAATDGLGPRPPTRAERIEQGWVRITPVVYEDFLPASAAGIFRSNLDGDGAVSAEVEGTPWSRHALAEAIGRPIADPYDLYDAAVERSWAAAEW